MWYHNKQRGMSAQVDLVTGVDGREYYLAEVYQFGRPHHRYTFRDRQDAERYLKFDGFVKKEA